MGEAPESGMALSAEDWAGARGAQWRSHLDQFEGMLVPPGTAALRHADFRPGERVVDIGCGGGAISRAIAAAVGPQGTVLGLDISADLVGEARGRAAEAGLTNLAFAVGDAAVTMPAGAPFDRLFSRFGCMFFEQPYAAFANLHAMVRPGGRIDLCVWAPAKENGWMSAIGEVIGQHVDLPKPVPRAPGPCALDDPDYVRDLLGKAGFTQISFTPWADMLAVGGAGASPAQVLRFAMDGFSVCEPLAHAEPAVRDAAAAALLALFERHHDERGVMLPARTWLVTAYA